MTNPQDIADELIAAERERTAIGRFSEVNADLDLRFGELILYAPPPSRAR